MGRLKALQQILDQATPGAEGFLSIGRNGNIAELAIKWLNGDSEAAKRVAETLQASGISLADISAHAITVMAVELQRIDLQVDRHESRRDSLLRQMERRREGWPLCRVPDGPGRDSENSVRRPPAADRGTAAAASHVNSVTSSICRAFHENHGKHAS